MNFYVGQKVVCVNDRCLPDQWAGYEWDGDAPTIGNVYTVRSVHHDKQQNLVLWLNEIRRSKRSIEEWHDDLIGYGAERFRPLVERKTDISIFTEILNDVNNRQSANVD